MNAETIKQLQLAGFEPIGVVIGLGRLRELLPEHRFVVVGELIWMARP